MKRCPHCALLEYVFFTLHHGNAWQKRAIHTLFVYLHGGREKCDVSGENVEGLYRPPKGEK